MRPLRHFVPFAVGAAVLVLGSSASTAHHAFSAEFDANDPVMLEGKVSKVEWINPHAWIHLDVPGPAEGESVTWMVEGGTPNTLLRRGFTKHTLAIDTQIIVRGYRAKDKTCKPACKANGRDVTFTDGRKIFMGSSGTGAPRDGSDPREPSRK